MAWRRVGTALVFIPLFYLLVQYLPPVFFFLLVTAGTLIGQQEFYRFHYRKADLFQGLGLAAGLVLLAGFYLVGGEGFQGIAGVTAAVLGGTLFILLLSFLFRERDPGESLTGVAVILFGVFYVTWTLGHLISLRAEPLGIALVFFVVLVTWSGDTGAYYTGRRLGRVKLAPRISPGKTLEGAVGGLAASALAGGVSSVWFLSAFPVGEAVLLGLALGASGQVGDLIESMFKRSGGIKDSGWIVPGHGGILDRVDGLIFTAPLFYYYVLYLRP